MDNQAKFGARHRTQTIQRSQHGKFKDEQREHHQKTEVTSGAREA